MIILPILVYRPLGKSSNVFTRITDIRPDLIGPDERGENFTALILVEIKSFVKKKFVVCADPFI